MMSSRIDLRREHGFSLIEALIASALLGLFVVGSLTFINQAATGSLQIQQLSSRNIESNEIVKLIGDPTYFGMLASYPGNEKLFACAMEDAVNCEQGQSYPFIAIDLNTGEPLKSISGTTGAFVENSLSFQVHCEGNQASCDKASYFIATARTYGKEATQQTVATEKKVMVRPILNRVASFIPDTKLANGRPINVLLFVDSSGSMLAAKDQIKVALDLLIDQLATLDAKVGIYPLSATFSNTDWLCKNASGVLEPCSVFNVPPSSEFYIDSQQFFLAGTINNPTSLIGASPVYSFLSTDSDAQRTVKITAAKDRVDRLFTAGYSPPSDIAFCSLLHIFDTGSAMFPVDPMTPTIAMVITNENDESLLTTSFTEYISNMGASCWGSHLSRATKGAQSSTYSGSSTQNTLQYDAFVLEDGAVIYRQNRVAVIPSPYSDERWARIGQSCLDETQTTSATAWEDYLKTSQSVVSGLTWKYCTINHIPLSLPALSTSGSCLDPAKEAEWIGKFAHYKPGSCVEKTINCVGCLSTNFSRQETQFFPLAPQYSTTLPKPDVTTVLYNTIRDKTGTANFFFIPVILPTGTTCPITSGAQIGTNYEKLAALLGQSSNVTPLCSSDFGKKVLEISQYLSVLGASDLEIPLSIARSITGVEIQRGTEVLHPVSGVDYKVDGTALIFSTGYLQPTDLIRVFF